MNHVARTTLTALILAVAACSEVTEPVDLARKPALAVVPAADAADDAAATAAVTAAGDEADDITDALERIAGSFEDSPATHRLRAALRLLTHEVRDPQGGRARQGLRLADDALAALATEDDPGTAADLDAIRLVLDRHRCCRQQPAQHAQPDNDSNLSDHRRTDR